MNELLLLIICTHLVSFVTGAIVTYLFYRWKKIEH